MPQYQTHLANLFRSPCHGCRHARSCATNGQSCQAFGRYVISNRWTPQQREPTLTATAIAALRHRAQVERDAMEERKLLRRKSKPRGARKQRAIAAKEAAKGKASIAKSSLVPRPSTNLSPP